MDGPRDYHTKSVKQIQHVMTNMCNLKKKQMNKYKKTEIESKLVVTGGEGQISEGD